MWREEQARKIQLLGGGGNSQTKSILVYFLIESQLLNDYFNFKLVLHMQCTLRDVDIQVYIMKYYSLSKHTN